MEVYFSVLEQLRARIMPFWSSFGAVERGVLKAGSQHQKEFLEEIRVSFGAAI